MFPSTLFPLLIIVHLTYDIEHVTIIVYAFIVSLAYPGWAIFTGTLLAFGGATFYLALLQIAATFWADGKRK